MNYEELLQQLIDLKESGKEISKCLVVYKTRKGKMKDIEHVGIKKSTWSDSTWSDSTFVIQLS